MFVRAILVWGVGRFIALVGSFEDVFLPPEPGVCDSSTCQISNIFGHGQQDRIIDRVIPVLDEKL
jgi:hypothetical protein